MAKRSKFDIRYSGPIIAVAAAFLIALMWIRPDLNKFEPAPEIITQQQMMCKSYQTHERFVRMVVAKDFQAACSQRCHGFVYATRHASWKWPRSAA